VATCKAYRIVSVSVKYPAGHSYDFPYAATDYFCPFCGKQDVYAEDKPWSDDEKNVCIACGEDFTWSAGVGAGDSTTRQVVEQIRSVVRA
jgi:predicted RNA-binding Zn-ribbon protein involved in translation (DUF1610 family)